MTFLNPFLLLGLVAASIPIILHLIHLRKLRTIEFSTLSFLKELQKTRILRLKLRQLLLLILRTLLVVLVVLAFARPTLKGRLVGEARALTSAVLIIDDSNSMTASDEQGEYFRQAKDAALNLINLFKDGDEVCVIPLSAVGNDESLEPAPVRDLAVVRAAIRDLQTTAVHRHLDDALILAARVLSRSRNFNKEAYVISDFQEGTVTPGRTKGENRASLGAGMRAFFLPIGKGRIQNFGIMATTIPNSIVESGKPFVLSLTVGNYSGADVRNHLVSVFLNGSRVAQKGIDIPAGQVVRSEFSLIPKTSGFVDGMVELEDDDLLYDNRLFFSLHLPEKIRILLVGSEADTKYLSLALAARAEESSLLRVERTPPEAITPATLANQDVVLLTNAGQESTPVVEQLAVFVSNGGGLFIFPGPRTTTAAFNKTYAPLGLPPLGQIEAIPPGREIAAFAQIERAELRHPLFEGMFDRDKSPSGPDNRRTLESPQIRTLARFTPTPNALSVMTLSNGAPFLLEQRNGSGRVLIGCIPPTLEWSDFPLKGLFVPLVHRSISYLTQEQVQQQSAFAGDLVKLKVPDARTVPRSIQTPQGIEVPAHLDASGSSVTFHETFQPGLYTLTENAAPIARFAINVDPDESRTNRADDEMMRAMGARIGITGNALTVIGQAARADRVVLESRFGVELWKYLLMAALIIAVAEMIIARDRKSDSI